MRRAAAALALLLALAPAAAMAQAALSDRQVMAFIASVPAAKVFVDAHKLRQQGEAGAPQGQFGAIVDRLKGTGTYGEFAALVGRYGFASPEDWSQVAQRTVAAFVTGRMGERRGEMETARAQARDAIVNNAKLTPDQKQQMLKQLEASMTHYARNASPQDVAVVMPHARELEATFRQVEAPRR